MAATPGTWTILSLSSPLNASPTAQVSAPLIGKLEHLPLDLLAWEDFERLLWRMMRDVEGLRNARLYGTRGQAQRGLDIVALTSFNEGTPVSLIEAQAASKPVVSTRVGGIENIVLEGRSALLSQNNHVEHFADNLLSLIENDDLRRELSVAGRDFVEKRFHYTRLVDDMSTLYASLLAGVPIGF